MSPPPSPPDTAGGAALPLPRAAAICSSTYCHIALDRDPKHSQFSREHILLAIPKSQQDPSFHSSAAARHTVTGPKATLSFFGGFFWVKKAEGCSSFLKDIKASLPVLNKYINISLSKAKSETKRIIYVSPGKQGFFLFCEKSGRGESGNFIYIRILGLATTLA